MPRHKPVTDDERRQVADLHAEGLSRAAIARELGRSADTVGKIATDQGLTWDRTKTEVATRAKQADNASRRASAISRLYDLADRSFDRLEAPTFKAVADFEGSVHTTELSRDAAPPRDVRSLATTATNALLSAAKLEQIDAGRTDGPARSMLAELGGAIAALADELPDAEHGDTA